MLAFVYVGPMMSDGSSQLMMLAGCVGNSRSVHTVYSRMFGGADAERGPFPGSKRI